jgi:hypothetical protein
MIARKEKEVLSFFNVKKYVKLMLAFLKTIRKLWDLSYLLD